MKKYSIEDLKAVAKSRGGRCLSPEYFTINHRYDWECEKGHHWQTTANSILLRGSWCRICQQDKQHFQSRKYNIEDMKAIARKKGGNFESGSYTVTNKRYEWSCSKGHKWHTKASHVLSGHWCSTCSGNAKRKLIDLQRVAIKRGGLCLSGKYLAGEKPHQWKCHKGHIWKATASNVLRGTWCGKCLGKNASIDDMKLLAIERGGECLSEIYKDSKSPLEWICGAAHKWEATPSSVTSGSWCPNCAAGVSERICRDHFQTFFNAEFPQTKLSWLKNSRGNKMHLDGFSSALNLAFEHHGVQHSKTGYFTPTAKDLKLRKEDDQLKRALCEAHGITLVEISQIPPNPIKAKEHIEKALIEAGITLLPNASSLKIKLKTAYKPGKLEEFKKIASDLGGECLSTQYISSLHQLEFRCKDGHSWPALPQNIKRGHWCATCAQVALKTLDDMHHLAEQQRGKCLSDDYEGAHNKLYWECAQGHRWSAKPAHIASGVWCPSCNGGVRGNIERLQNIAIERGGKCLSKTYINSLTHLTWECVHGHQWKASPSNIVQGTWCPDCAGSSPLSIAVLQQFAESKKGKCISDHYINSATKYEWQCSRGHIWFAKASNIRTGHWCPKCAREDTNKALAKRKLTIEDMRSIADARGGECLSQEYINQITHLLWKCQCGKRWKATPKNIRKGRWCPVCRGKKPPS